MIGGPDGPLGRLRCSSRVPRAPTVMGRLQFHPSVPLQDRPRGIGVAFATRGRTICSCAFVSSSCSPSGFRPCTFGAVLTPRPLVILRRHMGPGGDLQRVDRCTALPACWAVLPVRGLWPAGQALQSGSRPSGPSGPPIPWSTASCVPPGSRCYSQRMRMACVHSSCACSRFANRLGCTRCAASLQGRMKREAAKRRCGV